MDFFSRERAARDDVLTRPLNSNLGLNGEVVPAASSGMRETCPIRLSTSFLSATHAGSAQTGAQPAQPVSPSPGGLLVRRSAQPLRLEKSVEAERIADAEDMGRRIVVEADRDVEIDLLGVSALAQVEVGTPIACRRLQTMTPAACG
jgi:hypothetical protein